MVCINSSGPILVLAAAVCSLHGEHLNLNKAFCAVGQARGFTVAEAAPDASGDAFVPASISQLRYNLVRHGLSLLLLHRDKMYVVISFLLNYRLN